MVICPHRDCTLSNCSHLQPHKEAMGCTTTICPANANIYKKQIKCISDFQYKMELAIKRKENK